VRVRVREREYGARTRITKQRNVYVSIIKIGHKQRAINSCPWLMEWYYKCICASPASSVESPREGS